MPRRSKFAISLMAKLKKIHELFGCFWENHYLCHKFNTKFDTMEQLLHYVFKHKLFPLKELKTSDGDPVEVIDPGLHNHNAGPDFFNAKVKIGQTLWVGNVEIHDKSSDWYLHGHDKDQRYNNVILHVARVLDAEVMNTNGEFVRQMQLDVPDSVRDHYDELQKTDSYPPCYKVIPDLSRLMVHAWMAALQTVVPGRMPIS